MLRVRDATAHDGAEIAAIYNHYVTASTATFEVESVTADAMGRRVESIRSAGYPYLVREAGESVVGYAYLARWKERAAYERSAEISVYVAHDQGGHGHGTVLYRELLGRARSAGIHAVLAGITLPNERSVAFHERFGFRHVGTLREVGWKFGRWIDVGYWELLIDGTGVVESAAATDRSGRDR